MHLQQNANWGGKDILTIEEVVLAETSGDDPTNEPGSEYDPKQSNKATAELLGRLIDTLHRSGKMSSDEVLFLFYGKYDEVE